MKTLKFSICLLPILILALKLPALAQESDLSEFGIETPQEQTPAADPNEEAEESEEDANIETDSEIIIPAAAPPQSIEVQWYLPEIGDTTKPRRTRVIIPGKTTPGARVFVNSKAIIVITKDKKVGYLPTKKAMATQPVAIADEDGLFELQLDLPNYTVQLPLGVVPPGSQKVARRYQLNLSVEKEKVRYTNLKIVSKSPAYTKRYGLWTGAGFNYLRYAQVSPDINADILFESFKGPSFFAKAWAWVNETWDISVTGQMSPGNTSSSESIRVNQGAYEWLIFAPEATYYPTSMRYDWFETYKAQLAWRFGLQHHIVPFIARDAEDNTVANVLTNDVTMATVGFKFLVRQHSRFTYELFMRYQYPMTSGETFEVKPKFAFDGSVGAIYEYTKAWRVGLFWYGQWHEYDYTHVDPYRKNFGLDQPTVSGSTTLFFSNVEIRGGFEFN